MWVAFLYMKVASMLLGSGDTSKSKRGMELLSLGFSVVKWIWGSMELIMLEKLLAVFSLLDDKGVIHIFKAKPEWIGGRDDCFGFELFHEQVGNKRADGKTHGCAMDLFKILTLEEETGILEAKLQQSNYLCNRNGGPFGR